MPFLVVTVEGALRAVDRGWRRRRRPSGASRLTVFRRVTLPLIAPSLVAGRGAVLGPRARRVRRDDHLRRQLPGHDPDHAARGLPRAGDRPGRGDRAQPGAAARRRSSCWSRCATAGCAARHERRCGAPARRGCASHGACARGEFALDVDFSRRRPARSSACSARTAPARRPCCARWPGCTPLDARAGSGSAGDVLDDAGDGRLRAGRGAAGRARLPGLPAVPAPERARQRRLRARGRGALAPEARRAAPRPWLDAARPRRAGRPQARPSCPAARRSGSRWPGRWPPSPELLLLDEPLAALDARDPAGGARPSCAATSPTSPARCCVVTHDPLEAMVLADRLRRPRGRPGRPGRHAGRGRPPPGHPVRRPAGRAEPLRRVAPATRRRVEPRRWRHRLRGRRRRHGAGTGDPGARRRPPVGRSPLHTERPGPVSPRNVWPGRSGAWSCSPTGCASRSRARRPRLVDVTPGRGRRARTCAPGRAVWLTAKATEIDVYADHRSR